MAISSTLSDTKPCSTFTHILKGYFTGTGASFDCPSASQVTLKDMNKIGQYLGTTKQ